MAQPEINQKRLFLGCFVALVATAFAFIVRADTMGEIGKDFNLSQERLGVLNGVGLFPFAISIILFSLFIDRIGYGVSMVFAFLGHTISAVIIVFAKDFTMLYIGTFIFALANGIVEAVINPVVATIYDKNKTHWLNILHAGWPGGLVLAGLLAIALSLGGHLLPDTLKLWQWKMLLLLAPPVIYGILLWGQKFPVQERVSAGVSYKEMLNEFGWGSAYICFFLLIAGGSQLLTVADIAPLKIWWQAAIAIIPTIIFGMFIQSFGRPVFVFLMLVMFLLATTELGTDGWISNIMGSVLGDPIKGTLFLVYTSAIMFVLRFFAGPIVHRISPLGLLAASAAVACAGLFWLSAAGSSIFILIAAATLYGFGKTFFWPTTLGVVSEQYPKGGTLMLNGIAGVGMLAVGVLGAPLIGSIQEQDFNRQVSAENQELANQIMIEENGTLGKQLVFNKKIDLKDSKEKTEEDKKEEAEAKKKQAEEKDAKPLPVLNDEEKEFVRDTLVNSKQGALAKIALLPACMFVCYIALIFYYRSKGGYQAEVLTGHAADDEKFTGGVEGPVE